MSWIPARWDDVSQHVSPRASANLVTASVCQHGTTALDLDSFCFVLFFSCCGITTMRKVMGRFVTIIQANVGQKVSGSMCHTSDGFRWKVLRGNKVRLRNELVSLYHIRIFHCTALHCECLPNYNVIISVFNIKIQCTLFFLLRYSLQQQWMTMDFYELVSPRVCTSFDTFVLNALVKYYLGFNFRIKRWHQVVYLDGYAVYFILTLFGFLFQHHGHTALSTVCVISIVEHIS